MDNNQSLRNILENGIQRILHNKIYAYVKNINATLLLELLPQRGNTNRTSIFQSSDKTCNQNKSTLYMWTPN